VVAVLRHVVRTLSVARTMCANVTLDTWEMDKHAAVSINTRT